MRELTFAKGDIRKNYVLLALPVVLSLVVTIIYNIADTFFVSLTQNAALVAGVSICTPVFTVLQSCGNMFGQGGGALIARFLGEKKSERIRRISSFGFYGAIFTGIIVGVVLLLFRQPLVYLLGADEGTFSYALEYYTIMAFGSPVLVLGFVHFNFVRCLGMTKQSMIGSVLGVGVNIVLDPILITGCDMGASGAALASVIGYVCTDVFMIFLVKKKCPEFSMNIRECKVSRREFGQLMGIGLSSAMVNLVQSVCLVITNQYLLAYGSDCIAAMGIALKVYMIASLVLIGFGFGGQAMIGYFYGAGDKKRLKQIIRFAALLNAFLALVMSVIMILLAPTLVDCFLHDPNIVEMGAYMLRWQLYFLVGISFFLSISVTFQSLGRVIGSLILSMSRQGFVYIVVINIAVRVGGLDGIVMSQAISDVISLALAVILYILMIRPILNDKDPVRKSM